MARDTRDCRALLAEGQRVEALARARRQPQYRQPFARQPRLLRTAGVVEAQCVEEAAGHHVEGARARRVGQVQLVADDAEAPLDLPYRLAAAAQAAE
jgi:GAF domain-containing protein